MNHLLNYLEHNGILLCNQNPFLPALEDIGCSWNDVVELIDNHQLFYCKVFQKRTTYLSAECYYLLKNLRCPKPLTPSAERIYSFLLNKAPAETTFLKSVSALSPKSYQQGFDFLLQNLYVTAFSNSQTLNPNWSKFPVPALRSSHSGKTGCKIPALPSPYRSHRFQDKSDFPAI